MRKLIIIIILAAGLIPAIHAQDIPAKGFAVMEPGIKFQTFEFTRHAVSDNDILIEILYAGICHSDIHTVQGDWDEAEYPLVPGHEIAGRIVQTGKNVKKFKVGDYAGIGCIINSCRACDPCEHGTEQFCERGMVGTYGSADYFHDGKMTQGGYADNYVIDERYAIKIPDNADITKVAPLLCAGITTYSPIHFSGVKRDDVVAVTGFGGLGHMAVQYMVKLGAKVTVFDRTEDKRADALKMGAVKYVNVNSVEELKGLENSFTFIISTISTNYDPMMYVRMLKAGGELAIVGMPALDQTPTIPTTFLSLAANRKVYGSLIGGIRETQEMLDYSVANNIYPQVEIIKADPATIEQAYKNVLDGKVKFRYVIDMKTLE
jgi:uncharacterized zinc-type alcohol dehydrogenase-like protein